jgi:hypothetical protein
MCCLATIFLVFGSRITILAWWFLDPQRFDLAFHSWVLPGVAILPAWIWALVGGIFLPWTTLAYLLVFPNGIVGNDWIILGLAFLFDLVSHGGGYHHRDRIRR